MQEIEEPMDIRWSIRTREEKKRSQDTSLLCKPETII